MKVVVDNGNVGALLAESLLEIRIHVAGNGLYAFHPLQTVMVDKVKDYLLFLAFCNPEDRSGLLIDDVRGILVPSMQEELVDSQKGNWSFDPFKDEDTVFFNSIEIEESFLVDILDNGTVYAGHHGDILESVPVGGKKRFNVVLKWPGDSVFIRLERD